MNSYLFSSGFVMLTVYSPLRSSPKLYEPSSPSVTIESSAAPLSVTVTPGMPSPSIVTEPLMIAVRLIVPAKLASATESVATRPCQVVVAKSISSLSTEMSTRYAPASRGPNV